MELTENQFETIANISENEIIPNEPTNEHIGGSADINAIEMPTLPVTEPEVEIKAEQAEIKDEKEEPEPEPKKSKRGGRRPGSGRKPQNEKEEEPDPIEEIAEEINGEKKEEFNESDYETIIVKADTEEKKEYKAFLTGMMLLMVMNLFIPSIALKMYGAVNPKAKKILASDVQLDDKQLAILEACADEVATEIFKKMPPIAQLGIGFTVMSIGNIMVKTKTME